ncbi:MAG: histone deacetylase family protein [Hyphomicrobiaceae bacterium]
MTTLYLTHPAYLEHSNGEGHPERPDRLRAIEKVVAGEDFAELVHVTPAPADEAIIELVHPRSYIDAIKDGRPRSGIRQLDPDTAMVPGSWDAALLAVGAGLDAVDKVMSGEAQNAFCAVRPCGHHAETARAMGFCIFANVAIAAKYARQKYGLDRVAVIDFDVHHGNGTQDIFWSDKDLFLASTHQMPLFPGTGAPSEEGASGNICNVPLSAGSDGSLFKEGFRSRVLPALNDFAPDFILISAGFDAHRNDPLASINLVEDDFAWATSQLAEVADKRTGGRVVSMLEGGYDLAGLANSVDAHLKVLMDAGD